MVDESDKPSSPRRRPREPLQLQLTVRVKTGDAPGDCVTLLDDKQLPMVGSVFTYRDRIRAFLAKGLVKVALLSPAVQRELAPGLTTLLGRRRR